MGSDSLSQQHCVGGGWLDLRVPVLGFLTISPIGMAGDAGERLQFPITASAGSPEAGLVAGGTPILFDLIFSDPSGWASLLRKRSAKCFRALVMQFRLDLGAVCLKGNELS